jgi:hypothetical protein
MRTTLGRAVAVLAASVAAPGLSRAADVPEATIIPGTDRIDYSCGKDLVTRYHVGPDVAKPCSRPLNGPGGLPQTRAWPQEKGWPGESIDPVRPAPEWRTMS